MTKLLGIQNDLYCRRLSLGAQRPAGVSVEIDIPARNAIKLRERNLSAAFLAPIDFAKDSSDYVILRDIMLHSLEASDTISLCFKDGLHSVDTVAIDPSSSSEIVLARIILAEEFDLDPKFVVAVGTVDEKLRLADAALLVGDASLRVTRGRANTIDLVDHWNDMTGLPYVHGFWCTREGDLSDEEIDLLQKSPLTSLEALAGMELPGGFSLEEADEYLGKFSLTRSEAAIDGLREFLHFAYFHGIIPDVPEVTLFPPSPLDDTPASDISIN